MSAPSRVAGLRVLGFCDYLGSTTSGGAERVAGEVFRRLVARGASIDVIALGDRRTAGVVDLDGIRVHTVRGLDLSRLLGAQLCVGPTLRRAARDLIAELKPDVLHATSIHFHGSLVAGRMARESGLPLVTTAHLGSVSRLPVLTRVPTVAWERTLARRLLKSSAAVTAVSAAVRDHVMRITTTGIEVVPNGVSARQFLPPASGPERERAVVFVGRLIENKGPDVLLDAYLHLRDPSIRLTFVGDGPMRADLERRVRRAHVSSSVTFAGHVDDVAPHLWRAAVLARPSLTEGLSLAILEAMIAGAVPVVSDIDANRALVDDGTTGRLTPPGDVTALARAIHSILEDDALAGRLRSAGRATAAAYSWDRTADLMADVLTRAARGAAL